MGAIEKLTAAVQKLNKKVDNLPVQGLDPHPAEKGKFADKEGLKLDELSEFLGIGKSTIRKYQDQIPHTYIGNRLIFSKSAVQEWLKKAAFENQKKPGRMEVDGAIIRKLSS